MPEYDFDARNKTEIHMEDCYSLGCNDKLKRLMKEHKKRLGRDHVCVPQCNRWFTREHHKNHAWYNAQKNEQAQ